MIKKIIALFLALSILPTGLITASAQDSQSDSSVYDAYEVLSALGYLSNDYTLDMIEDMQEFTRAEFAEMTYKVFGNGHKSKEVYFHDVPATHFASESISSLVEMNILTVGDDKLFNPNEPISKIEAAKVLLCALGYDTMIRVRGGWPSGVEAMVSATKLYKNLSAGDILSYSDMIVMVYNALTSEILEMDEINDESPIYKSKGGTYLSVYRDIYLGRGTVSAVDGVSIYGDRAKTGMIQIDDLELEQNHVNADEFLGREVDYMYSYDDVDSELIWIKARRDDDVLLLNKFDNQPKFSENCGDLTYYTETGKRKSVTVSSKLNLIFNGEYVDSGMKDILLSDFYDVRLVKSGKNNSVYDVAIVSNYENYKIVAFPDDNTIYIESCDSNIPNRSIKLDDYDKIEFITSGGMEINPFEISFNSILSVFESKNKSRMKVVVSTDSVKGTINSKSVVDDYTVFFVNGSKYAYYKTDIVTNYKASDNVSLLLDYNGRIAMVDDGKSTGRFAYIISASYDNDESPDEIFVRMYTKEYGVKQYTIKDRVRVDGVFYKDMNLAYGALSDNFKPQVIAYEMNEEGNIIMIDLPAPAGDTSKKTSDNMLVEIEETSKLYDSLSKRLGHRTILNNNSVIFGVPGNVETAAYDEYSSTIVSNLEFERTYEFISYSYTLDDEFFFSDVLAVKTNFGVGYWVSTRFAVTDIKKSVNDDNELIYIVDGYHGSERKEIKLRESCSPRPEELHKGDVINVGGRIGEEVVSYELSYCPHTEPHTHITSNTGYSTGGYFEFVGYLYDIKDGAVKVSYEDPAVWNQIVGLQGTKILLYDSKQKNIGFKEVSAEELLTYKIAGDSCDRVLVYINSSQMRNFVVFR